MKKTQCWSLWFCKCTWLDAQVCWAFGNNQHNIRDESDDDVGCGDDNDDEPEQCFLLLYGVSIVWKRANPVTSWKYLPPSLSIVGRLFSSICFFLMRYII